MFKKLKDKIAEEVKSSPQRVQQLAQGVQAVVQSATGTQTQQNDDGLISLGDTSDKDDSFSSVSLKNSSSPSYKTRRNSNSSMASDASFLPSFESQASIYHLQSDVDASASELEDSYSGQLERVSKEQLLQAYRRMQMKYNKYRGRYTDLANHYRRLELENARVKSVLVETQDKALRRVSELKEQCSLEQSAKAHMETLLREDLNEKQYMIDTLTTKVQLLQSNSKESDGEMQVEFEKSKTNLKERYDSEVQELRQQMKEQSEHNDRVVAELRATLIIKEDEIVQLQDKTNQLEIVTEISNVATLEKQNEQFRHELDVAHTNNSLLQKRLTHTEMLLTEAENAAHKENNSNRNATDLLAASCKKLETEKNLLMVQIENLEKQYCLVQDDMKKLDQEKQVAEKKYSDIKSEKEQVISDFKKDFHHFQTQTEHLETEQACNKEKNAANEKQMLESINKLQKCLQDREDHNCKQQLEVVQLKNTICEKEKESEEKNSDIYNLKQKIENLTILKNKLQAENESFSNQQKKTVQENKILKQKVEELTSHLEQLKSNAKQENDKQTNQEIEKMSQIIHSLEEKLRNNSYQCQQVMNDLDERNKTCNELKTLVEATKQELVKVTQANEQAVETRTNELDQAKLKLEQQKGLLDRWQELHTELTKERECLFEEISDQKLQLEQQRSELADHSVLVKQLEQQQKTLTVRVTQLQQTIKQLEENLQQRMQEIATLKVENDTLQGELNTVQAELMTEQAKQQLLQNIDEKRLAEIAELRQCLEQLAAKLALFENMEASARVNAEYLQDQLDKTINKNEKLKAKLDETLVTLEHCTDLSNSTEMEYLKNILYNYMIGKESIVLARVIAAVCKFDPLQTEIVIQKETQKQTLFGQLGII